MLAETAHHRQEAPAVLFPEALAASRRWAGTLNSGAPAAALAIMPAVTPCMGALAVLVYRPPAVLAELQCTAALAVPHLPRPVRPEHNQAAAVVRAAAEIAAQALTANALSQRFHDLTEGKTTRH